MTATARSEPQLAFFEEEHRYELDGVAIPSVTTVLSAGRDLSRIPRWTGLLGTLVHRACELDSLGDLDESSLVAQEIDGRMCDPWPYLHAWRSYRGGVKPEACELRLWGEIDGLRYGATIDVVWLYESCGRREIEDIKTSRQPRRMEHGPQVQAYRHAYQQRFTVPVASVACVYLRDDETYERVPYDEDLYLETFREKLHRWYEADP